MKYISTMYKALRKAKEVLFEPLYTPYAILIFYLNGVKVGSGLKVRGILKVHITRRGCVCIGNNCEINSGQHFNIIGRQQKSIFWVEGALSIGDNFGMSSAAIICNHEIQIGNNVTIGGNTVIYDTDFHALDSEVRKDITQDKKNANWGKVTICDNVFIGAHSTLLKGVTIGKNAIVGACSVVTKDIPANEIWAVNPAKLISKVI